MSYLSFQPVTHAELVPLAPPADGSADRGHAVRGDQIALDELRGHTAFGRAAVRYLRFRRPVVVDRLELPLSTDAGRWVPTVPSHPAHIVVSVLDRPANRWRTVTEVDLPEDPRIAGEGLTQDTPMAEMEAHFAAIVRDTLHLIEIGGIETDILRVVCDREHPVWPNHGECNGGEHNVPFAILGPLRALGREADSQARPAPRDAARDAAAPPASASAAGPPSAAPPPAGPAPAAGPAARPPDPNRAPGEATAARLPLLSVEACSPVAPEGMRVRDLPAMVLFESPRFSIGFSLRRPMLMHLGWDAWADRGRPANRLCLRRKDAPAVGGLSGPLLRGLGVDEASHLWGGTVDLSENEVLYRVTSGSGVLRVTARFIVRRDGFDLELEQECGEELPVLEAEAWRLAWDLGAGMTAPAAFAAAEAGRNGGLSMPVWIAGDGAGCLTVDRVEPGAGRGSATNAADGTRWFLQTESYRSVGVRTDGIVLAARPGPSECLVLPAGSRRATLRFSVDAFRPRAVDSGRARGTHTEGTHTEGTDVDAAGLGRAAGLERVPGVRRYWGTVFSCFRPELAGFSNHAASTNCHVNQWAPTEIVAYTERPPDGPDPVALAKFTIGGALFGGGGYGYHRSLYLDSDPVLLSMAGRIYQTDGNAAWIAEVLPGLLAAYGRVAATIGDQGLALCRALSGNRGSHRWSSNAMDVVGFGHIDAYVNAWTYRALRTCEALFAVVDRGELSSDAGARADRLRSAFAGALVNPETGWVAGWRSRDGMLHDYGFLWVNGPALAFGLLEDAAARRALEGLEELRASVGLESARTGLPANLLPIDPEDQMAAIFTESGQPSFELYTDGGMSGSGGYYLRALAAYGLSAAADRLAADLDNGYAHGVFAGAMGGGQEFLTWEGLPSGYEGTLIVRMDSLYAIAIQAGLVEPYQPEWWPSAPR